MRRANWIVTLVTMLTLAGWGGSQATAAKKGAAFLPEWKDGPFAGKFAVYQDRLFDFVLSPSGGGMLYLKDNDGEVVGPPIPLGGMGLRYSIKDKSTGKSRTIPRRFVEALEEYKPLRDPRDFTIKGLAEDGVEFSYTYKFGRSEFTYQFEYRDSPETTPKTHGGTGVSFTTSHSIPGNVEQPEREKILAGCILKLKQGKTNEYPYWKSAESLGGNVEQIEVTGPWGPRELTIRFQGMSARPHMYRGNCPWQGYSFGINFSEASVRKLKITVKVK